MRLLKTTCVILTMGLFLGAAAKKQYVSGTIVDVQEKKTTRVLYYQVDTPITQDDPYYEVSVQIKDTVYSGRYTPMHSSDSLPEDWTLGSVVQARIDGHHLVLKRPGGTEMSFAFTKPPVVKTVPSASAPAPASK
jgi:hypothetical protein